MDNFKEEVASKYNKTFNNIAYFLCWVVMIISVIIAMIGFSEVSTFRKDFMISGGIQFVVFAGVAVLLWLKKDNLKIEYDYTFTNGDLDIGKVFGNSRRRLMTSLNMKNVEAAGFVTHQSFNRYVNDKEVKKHNWFVNRGANLCYFYFIKENGKKQNIKHLIILELSDEMLAMARPYLKFGVWQGETVR